MRGSFRLLVWFLAPSLSTCYIRWTGRLQSPATSTIVLRSQIHGRRPRRHHQEIGRRPSSLRRHGGGADTVYEDAFRIAPVTPSTWQFRAERSTLCTMASCAAAAEVPPPPTKSGESLGVRTSKVPSYGTLVRYLSTESLIWVSEPLLSLVDTACVSWARTGTPGRLVELAAMGPATTYMDTALYLTYFLAICTTNQIAELQASGRFRELRRSTSRLIGVALLCGGGVAVLTGAFGGRILTHLAGTSARVHPEIVNLATAYACLRAAAAPLSVVGMVAQAFCLVTGHMRTVAESVLLSLVVNTVLDIVLTKPFGMLGAAAATAIASSMSAMWLLRMVFVQVRTWRNKELENQPDSRQVDGTIPFISLPDRQGMADLFAMSAPLCFRMWAIMASYAMLTVRAGEFGAVALAAQNILIRAFYFLCAAGDSLSSATQTFIPATLYPTHDKPAYRQVTRRLSRLAIASAVLGGALSLWSFINLSRVVWLVGDAHIAALLHASAPYLATCLFLHPFVTLTEGLTISKRDFRNVVCTYSVTVAAYVLLLRHTVGSLADVWRTLVFWQGLRFVNYRLWRRKNDVAARAM